MKHVQIFSTTILLIFLLANAVGAVTTNMGFTTESLSEDDINTVLKNLNISILTEEPPKKSIQCFDVNENGLIAIGCNNSDNNKTVCIYTSNGDFQYGYSFKTNGNVGVELHENILMIYLVRGGIAISIDSMGEIKSVCKIQKTTENTSYWNNYVYLTNREVDGNKYTIKNKMGIFNIFASSYSQLVVTNTNGEDRVIYDVSSIQFSNTIVAFIGVLVFVCLVVSLIIWRCIKLKRDN